MVDTKTPGDKTLSVPTKTLTLKPRVETGTVRQSFSHGRTKQVVVEKRGKRRIGEEDRDRQEEEAKRKAELEAKKRFGEAEAKTAAPAPATTARPAARPTASAVPPARAPGVASDGSDDDEGPRQVRRGPGGAMRPAVPPKTTHKPGPQKERGRLTLVTALNADEVRERSIASFRRRPQRLKGRASN